MLLIQIAIHQKNKSYVVICRRTHFSSHLPFNPPPLFFTKTGSVVLGFHPVPALLQ